VRAPQIPRMPTADADSVGKRRNESDVDERAVTGRGDTVQQDVDGAADVLPAEAIGTQPAVQQEPVGERQQDRGQGVFGDRRQVAAIDPLPDPPSQDRPVAFHGALNCVRTASSVIMAVQRSARTWTRPGSSPRANSARV
jgi:hypothetical protein